ACVRLVCLARPIFLNAFANSFFTFVSLLREGSASSKLLVWAARGRPPNAWMSRRGAQGPDIGPRVLTCHAREYVRLGHRAGDKALRRRTAGGEGEAGLAARVHHHLVPGEGPLASRPRSG